MTVRFAKQALTLSIAALMSSSINAGTLTDLYNDALLNDAAYQESRAAALANGTGRALALANLYPSISLAGTSTSANTFNNSTQGMTLSINQTLFSMPAWYGYKATESLPEITQLSIEAADQGLDYRVMLP